MTYRIETTRRSAALYLAWEFGIQRAVIEMRKLERSPSGMFLLPDYRAFTRNRAGRTPKRLAENWLSRIRGAVAWQEGRLGSPLTAGDLYLVRR